MNSEQPTLNKGGGLRHNLAGAYTSVIGKLPKKLSSSSSTCDVIDQSQVDKKIKPSQDQLA